MRTRISISIVFFAAVSLTACAAGFQFSPTQKQSGSIHQSLVRVTVTSQGHIFHQPWQQRRPVTQTAIGVVVADGQVLVQAAMLGDHRYIELETIDTQIKDQARVRVVDYESNLALIEPLDPTFLSGHHPMELARQVLRGDELAVLQVKPNGDVLPSQGQVTSVELGAYTQGNFFLTYRLDNALQYRFKNVTLPVTKGSRLAGLMLRQSTGDRSIDVIALPVIRHFLKDADGGDYHGFPTAGFRYGGLLDPQLRRYLGVPEGLSGVYIQNVVKGGPADLAGIQAGDVMISMGNHKVSNTGQFMDPDYGQTSLIHLIRSEYFVGDQVGVQLLRGGRLIESTLILDHRRPEEFLVPPYVHDRTTQYLIVGGLVILELTTPYLQEYGNDWLDLAPVGLLFYSQNQDYLNGDGREKIVLISSVIPTPATIGYEELSDLEILRVNDRPIGKLSDVLQALDTPQQGFHKFELKQNPKVIFLDALQMDQVHELIERTYGIPIPALIP